MNLRFNSLFWRFFVAILIANLLVMAITSYIAIEVSEEVLGDEHHSQLTLNTAAFVIERYESQPKDHRKPIRIPRLDRGHHDNWDGDNDHRNRRHGLRHRLEIYNKDNQRIFGRLRKKYEHHVELTYISPNTQQPYRVVTTKPRIPPRINHLLGVVQSARFILLILTSIVLSFLLSLLISRPLKKLGLHTEKLANGKLNTSMPGSLLKRKDEVGDLARQLNTMGWELDKLINSKQQLLHDVSHELRAPLARLQAASALLLNDNKKSERIERECERMNALIQQILDYSRLDDTALAHSSFSLSALIEQCVQDVQFEYANHPIHCTEFPSPAIYTGNADKLHSAIENILRNACKHTADNTTIDVEMQQNASNWLIRIRDHGTGVEATEFDKLCKPFYRGNNRMHGEGFGLGLSIAHRAIELHGGSLQLANHPNGGLQVTIKLPYSP